MASVLTLESWFSQDLSVNPSRRILENGDYRQAEYGFRSGSGTGGLEAWRRAAVAPAPISCAGESSFRKIQGMRRWLTAGGPSRTDAVADSLVATEGDSIINLVRMSRC
jgi:hypothetical protein